jgi:hypothetical protein
MEWTRNIIENTLPHLVGAALTAAENDSYCLWIMNPQTRQVRRLTFNEQGTPGASSPEWEPMYDALLAHENGYVRVRYHNGAAALAGYAPNHRELWREELPDADSRHWSMATGTDGKMYVLYSSCNRHDAYRRAHVILVDTAGEKRLAPFFTAPDDDFPHAQLLIAQPERLAVCVKNRGADTIFYFLDLKAEILSGGAFAEHPHSRLAVPLCQTPLENGDILMGGYKEENPGERRAWTCRFDADLNVLHGRVVAGEHAEHAVTSFAPQPDGTVLALCPPWKILRLNARGMPTHVWEAPPPMRRNSLADILAAPGGGCFITGRSFAGGENAHTPAVWLGKLAPNEFTEL